MFFFIIWAHLHVRARPRCVRVHVHMCALVCFRLRPMSLMFARYYRIIFWINEMYQMLVCLRSTAISYELSRFSVDSANKTDDIDRINYMNENWLEFQFGGTECTGKVWWGGRRRRPRSIPPNKNALIIYYATVSWAARHVSVALIRVVVALVGRSLRNCSALDGMRSQRLEKIRNMWHKNWFYCTRCDHTSQYRSHSGQFSIVLWRQTQSHTHTHAVVCCMRWAVLPNHITTLM